MNILALDPSILHLGWAVMLTHPTEVELRFWGTIIAPKESKMDTLVERIQAMTTHLNSFWLPGNILEQLEIDRIVIERPEPWGSYKSLASAQSGSLQKLTLLTGALAGWAFSKVIFEQEEVVLVKVSTWKGQLPKGVTKKRMEKKYNCTFATSDEADATGLGDWYLERERRK